MSIRLKNKKTLEQFKQEMRELAEENNRIMKYRHWREAKELFEKELKPNIEDPLYWEVPYYCPFCDEQLDEFDIYTNNLEYCNNCNQEITDKKRKNYFQRTVIWE